MAQYFIDGSKQSSGSPVPGWTGRLVPNGSFQKNGNNLQLNGTSTGTKVYGCNAVDGVSDNIEILVRFYFSSDVGKQGIASLRYSGNSEATTKGYTLSGTVISGVGQLAIDEGSTGYAFWTPWNYLPNIWYWARYRIDGNRMRAKVWNDGSAEPDWMIDNYNSVTSTGDYNGVHSYNTGNVYYSQVSFGTGGDSAPTTNTTLSPANISHSVDSDTIQLIQQHNITVNSSAHSQSVDSIISVPNYKLTVYSSRVGVFSDKLSLTRNIVLSVNSAQNNLRYDNIQLIGGTTLTVNNLLHGISSDVVPLSQAQTISVNNSSHTIQLDDAVVSKMVMLNKPDDVYISVRDDGARLASNATLIIDDSIIGIHSPKISIINWDNLGVDIGKIYIPKWKGDGELEIQDIDSENIITPVKSETGWNPITNEIYTNLEFEDTTFWISENDIDIIVEEYKQKNKLTNVDSGGLYKKTGAEHGNL